MTKEEEVDKTKEEDVDKTKEEDEIPLLRGDPRFVHTNQTVHCFTSFVDYHRCTRLLGDDDSGCNILHRYFKAYCPNEWVDKWNEQIDEGKFPVRFPPSRNERETGPTEEERVLIEAEEAFESSNHECNNEEEVVPENHDDEN